MSSEDQENDQFKLISLDSNSVKPYAQKARQAYSSYGVEEGSGSASTLNLSEDNKEKAIISEKKTSPLPTKGNTNQLNKPPVKQEVPKSVVTRLKKEEPESNYEEEDDYEADYENVSLKIDELKESISVLWANFYETMKAFLLKVGSVALKPVVIIAAVIAKAMSVPLLLINKLITLIAQKVGVKTREEKRAEVEAQVEEIPKQIKKSSFSDMMELNIIFTDNYKKNLYNKPHNAAFRLSKMEEQLIMANAIEAIKECAEFTAELPAPAEGIYSGVAVSRIMEEVTDEDVFIFLGFVKAFPGKYIGKTWKISETFATWLINNSPLG